MVTVFINKDKYNKFIISRKNIILHINEIESVIDGKTYITADEISIPFNRDDNDKARIISTIIKAKYNQDDMDAVRNNYELAKDGKAGDKTESYTKQYNDMQDWRAYAKSYADEIINSAISIN